jgi:hypothetical protein
MSGVIKFTEDMKDMGALSSLVLKGNSLANREAGATLGSMLKTCTSLTALDVSENSYDFCDGSGFASEIASGLKDAKGSLSRLDLSGNNQYFSDSPGFIRPIANALKTNTSITELNLSNNNLNPEAAKIFSEDMKDMGSLSKLTFCGNGGPMGREGDPVTIDTTMTKADFSGKNLGTAGAQILAAFMSTKLFEAKGSLASLDISDNRIGDEQQAKIKEICAGKSIKCAL